MIIIIEGGGVENLETGIEAVVVRVVVVVIVGCIFFTLEPLFLLLRKCRQCHAEIVYYYYYFNWISYIRAVA